MLCPERVRLCWKMSNYISNFGEKSSKFHSKVFLSILMLNKWTTYTADFEKVILQLSFSVNSLWYQVKLQKSRRPLSKKVPIQRTYLPWSKFRSFPAKKTTESQFHSTANTRKKKKQSTVTLWKNRSKNAGKTVEKSASKVRKVL